MVAYSGCVPACDLQTVWHVRLLFQHTPKTTVPTQGPIGQQNRICLYLAASCIPDMIDRLDVLAT